MLQEAVRLHQAGNLDGAAQLYRRVLSLDPKNPDALHLLGMVALQTGQNQAAIELIRQALAVNSREASFHFHLGCAQQALGQLDQAMASYRRALTLKPNDSDTLNNLSNALAAQSKFEEAAAGFRRIISIEPNNEVAWSNLGNVLWSMGDRDQAEAHYRKAVSLKPDYADGLNNLGNIYRDKGALSEALSCYQRALALNPANPDLHNNVGLVYWGLGRRGEAMAAYRDGLKRNPNHVECQANLAIGLWEKGALDEADAIYRRILPFRQNDPEMLNNFVALSMARGDGQTALEVLARSLASGETRRAKRLFVSLAGGAEWGSDSPEIRALMIRALTEPWDRPAKLTRGAVNLLSFSPVIGPAVTRANTAWPKRLSLDALLGETGLAGLAEDALLMALLTSTPNTDMKLERFLTLVRSAMAEAAPDEKPDEKSLAFLGALAQQCFINEYVFLPSEEEDAAAERLHRDMAAALDEGRDIAPLLLLSLACHRPLHSLPAPERLLERSWPTAIEAVLTQQVREPLEEARLKRDIPRLTPIEDSVSQLVRDQYEENPYPRWVRVAGGRKTSVLNSLAEKFAAASFSRQPGREMKDFLIAGCGTGQHSISTSQTYGGGTMLAVDLSLTSLAYAKRKSQELGLEIEYGQADILELGALGQSFDVIESIGVLHHMQDPFAGWKVLVSLLRPQGFMWLGFYSAVARRNIVEARARIAARGIGSSAADIRRFRQELVDAPDAGAFASIHKSEDFFSVSACRDLLFHAQEHRMTLPAIAAFLKEHNLTFIGFELDDAIFQAYRRRFPDDSTATDLANWDIFEQENPGMFAALYVFWVQKA
jgi:Flp pilus assembly protein TadD/2-polyprenyl-3-methyl-5-hydroxy-6-metoxy-1,4-benzoquinol methylase